MEYCAPTLGTLLNPGQATRKPELLNSQFTIRFFLRILDWGKQIETRLNDP